jgi:hypothetical protein
MPPPETSTIVEDVNSNLILLRQKELRSRAQLQLLRPLPLAGEGVAGISTFSVGRGCFPLPLPRVEFLSSPPPQAGEGANTTAAHFLTQYD